MENLHSHVIGVLVGSSVINCYDGLTCRSEFAATLLRKEPGFTRFRVMTVTCARYFDIRKARRVLGYEPIVELSEGVRRSCKVI
jgi:nucleoside-diphosphate-sugar epimerase